MQNGPEEHQSLVCDNPEHQEIEHARTRKGQAHFVLKERLLRQCVSHPEDAVPKDVNVDKLEDVEDVEENFVIDPSGRVVPDQLDSAGNIIPDNNDHREGPPPKKVRAQFSRKRSHNEQIFVTPCGEIVARETFYGAEVVSTVVVSMPCMPMHILSSQAHRR